MHNDLTLPTSLVRDATLEVACPLPRRRLWNYQILALGCSGSPVTNLSELSKISWLIMLYYNSTNV